MRVLIHSNGPMVLTGYGVQTRLLIERLREMGHDPAVSAFYGLSGSAIEWNGIPIYPAGSVDFGLDMLHGHAAQHGADVVVTLMDTYKLGPIAKQLHDARTRYRTAMWVPVDCTPLSRMDREVIALSGATPVAMSRFGLAELQEAGFPDALYAPHAVDTHTYRPPADREALREAQGLPADRFVVGICAANNDTLRKAWPEQFAAFAALHAKHPDTLLLVHSVPRAPQGIALDELAEDMGIAGAVVFSDHYAQLAGLMGPAVMADWYGCLDVLLACSYAEGFGVPIIEAQACGTPVIATDAASMTELVYDGWQVAGLPFWNYVHRAAWRRPVVEAIVEALCEAYETGRPMSAARREACRDHAVEYDTHLVANKYWAPILESWGSKR